MRVYHPNSQSTKRTVRRGVTIWRRSHRCNRRSIGHGTGTVVVSGGRIGRGRSTVVALRTRSGIV